MTFRTKVKTVVLCAAVACGVRVGDAMAAVGAHPGKRAPAFDREELHAQAVAESLKPVRPGIPGKRPFWNVHARRFMYAPAFGAKPIRGIASYVFTAVSEADGTVHAFKADRPWASLAPVWKNLPVGNVILRIEAEDDEGDRKKVFERKFYRAAVFRGPYGRPAMPYRQSALTSLRKMYRDARRKWTQNNRGPCAYCKPYYPSKMNGAVISAMVSFHNMTDDRTEKQTALAIARSAADFLIEKSEPRGAPFEFFPPTYLGKGAAASSNKGIIMLIYPGQVGLAYLRLFKATRDRKYLDAAEGIARTYVRIQLDSGSWVLKARLQDGKPTTGNQCVPTGIAAFLDRMAAYRGMEGCRKASDRAIRWLFENPLRTFNWQGQFEDVNPSKPYRNLSRGQAAGFAVYLLKRSGEHPEYLAWAEELVNFCEDQFVIWEGAYHLQRRGFPKPPTKWFLPAVAEQYYCIGPVDASVSSMIRLYQKAHEVTGRDLYLAKCLSLANTLTVAQEAEKASGPHAYGRFPTWLRHPLSRDYWLNCDAFDAHALLSLAAYLDKRG